MTYDDWKTKSPDDERAEPTCPGCARREADCECPDEPKCRRCSECVDEEHHWLEDCPEDVGPRFVCKHCDATTTAIECAQCGEYVPGATTDAEGVCGYCRSIV